MNALIERTKIEIGRGGETNAATKPAAQLGLMLVRNAARLLHAPQGLLPPGAGEPLELCSGEVLEGGHRGCILPTLSRRDAAFGPRLIKFTHNIVTSYWNSARALRVEHRPRQVGIHCEFGARVSLRASGRDLISYSPHFLVDRGRCARHRAGWTMDVNRPCQSSQHGSGTKQIVCPAVLGLCALRWGAQHRRACAMT